MAETGPLDQADLALLEATLLPTLERHHLRLLAHCLRSLQQIAGRREGSMPSRSSLRSWLAHTPSLASEPEFRQVLLEQLESGARQLEQLAIDRRRDPLALELGDLIDAAEAAARSRLSLTDPPPPPG